VKWSIKAKSEADVYAQAEFILRLCSKCRMSTQWRRATGDDVGETAPLAVSTDSAQYSRLGGTAIADPEVSPAPFIPPTTASDANGASRRRDVRTRVSFSARIRQNGIEKTVVCCNVSKGGFSFRSPKSYLAGSDIDVALPYYPGMEPPFVRATIRHSLVFPNNRFHYGVKYAPINKISKSLVVRIPRGAVETTFPSRSTLFFPDHA
jgi:hypothetical protein